MLILGLETSCDETAAGVLEARRGKFVVRSNVIHSQIATHRAYGGVVPEVAAREHVKNILPVIDAALHQAGTALDKIDRIAVTRGPGLITSLLVGVETAKTLAWYHQIPLVGTNHLAGHVLVSQLGPHRPLATRDWPLVALIVSGGHTELTLWRSPTRYQKIGATLDDAAGECFDKVGKLLGLPYPGGPVVSRLAEQGDPTRFDLPRPLLKDRSLNFSFSGLKTAVRYHIDRHGRPTGKAKKDFCASVQQAIIDVLIAKSLAAVKKYSVKTFVLGGGVAANQALREQLAAALANQTDVRLRLPNIAYCGDNAMLAAVAGYYARPRQDEWKKLEPDPNLSL